MMMSQFLPGLIYLPNHTRIVFSSSCNVAELSIRPLSAMECFAAKGREQSSSAKRSLHTFIVARVHGSCCCLSRHQLGVELGAGRKSKEMNHGLFGKVQEGKLKPPPPRSPPIVRSPLQSC